MYVGDGDGCFRLCSKDVNKLVKYLGYCYIAYVKSSMMLTVTFWFSILAIPDDRAIDPGREERILPLTSVSRPALEPTQPPVQWVSGALSPELKRGRFVTLTTHPHLVPMSRMSRSYTFCPAKRLRGM
jgi:hypothetical protein